MQLAVDFKCGIRLEDLSNIRQTTKHKKEQKSDASSNRTGHFAGAGGKYARECPRLLELLSTRAIHFL